MDAAYKLGAGRYIQMPGALKLAGKEIGRFGTRVFIIGGTTALSIVEDTLRMKLKESHLEYEFRTYNGYTDRETAAALAQYVREQGFEVVAGAGGGRIMDLVKAVAHLAGTPVVTIPTSAATCAAYTPMSVMYTKDGAALGTAGGNFYHEYEVSAVLVDEEIMVQQPPRYAAAGMLDSMAKFIEIQNGHAKIDENTFSLEMDTAYTLAAYIYRILERDCLKIYGDIRDHRLTKEVHDFLYINFVLTGFISGSSKALGQTALAHEMYYAARMFFTDEAQAYLHGEIVGTSLILQLCYNRAEEQIPKFKKFMKCMNMPVSLEDLGIPVTEENRQKIYRYLASTDFVEDTVENRRFLKRAVEAVCSGGCDK
ncbi:iron-containing alcohol dehydrogenase family protein [Diplocloster modestus]|uniref:Glycerol dehydrogenase n=1 Tax=Diplocloster modestus TaxID=2850322 RepID=A0ABS6K8G0_9FIRM|nr:iron-containing alcohol dehydrogenase family protein [Diplocloster modestus]MBU9726797.1 iron-containing alcohol dehydrogenase family protein [Diplocloster modestus]